MKGTFLIIPAYNEEKTVQSVLRKAKRYCSDIIVVDDGSKDRTFERASNMGVIVLRHAVNLGKGAALKTGCEFALRKGAKKMVIMDADDQHDAKLLPMFMNALDTHDMVYGYRKFDRNMPFLLGFGNRLINASMRLLYGVEVRDVLCGFRAWTRKAYRRISWSAMDYDVESEIVVRAAKSNLSYTQIPIPTVYLDDYKGTTPVDGVKILARIFAWRLMPR